MIVLQEVSKQYDHKGRVIAALRPTSLAIAAGEFVAVVGASGSGKTTLLSILGGMLAPTGGKITLDGQPLYDTTPKQRAALRRQKIGFVFQTFNLIPYLTSLENVKVPLMLTGMQVEQQEIRAVQLLERVGLAERLHHKPSELSIGQQQRVALARTLANDPPLVLADEPTGNLDPQTRGQVLDFLDELCREGRTVVMVTHDPSAAARAQRTLTLCDGAITSDSKSALRRVA